MARPTIEFDLDASGLGLLLAITDPKLYDRAKKAGLRSAQRGVVTSAAKEIRARYNISSARIKDKEKGIRAGRITPEVATVLFPKTPPTARAYGAIELPGRRGTAVKFDRKGRKQIFPKVFWINTAISGRLPMIREGPSRGNIRSFSGYSAASIFTGDSRYLDEIQAAVSERASEQFAKGVERELSRVRRGFG